MVMSNLILKRDRYIVASMAMNESDEVEANQHGNSVSNNEQ